MVEVYLTNAVQFTSCEATLKICWATIVRRTIVFYVFWVWAFRWSLELWTFAWAE